jgi:hypothetical protein
LPGLHLAWLALGLRQFRPTLFSNHRVAGKKVRPFSVEHKASVDLPAGAREANLEAVAESGFNLTSRVIHNPKERAVRAYR